MPSPPSLSFACLVALALVAGCLSPDGSPNQTPPWTGSVLLDGLAVHDGAGNPLPASRYPGELPIFEQRFVSLPHFDLSHWPGFEPTVDFTPDGTAFFSTFSSPMETEFSPAWQGPRQTIVLVAASADHGATWIDVSPPAYFPDFDTSPTGVSAALLHGGDTMSYTDQATGDLFVSALAAPCAVSHRTSDRGATWSTGAVCETQGQGMIDHQAFFTGRATTVPTGGEPVVYLCWSGLVFAEQVDFFLGQESPLPAPSSHRCSASYDGGQTFLATPPPFLANEHACWPYMSQGGMTGPDGTAYLPQGFCGRMDVAISRDNALTWEVVTVDSEHGASPEPLDEPEGRIAVDSAGNVYYAWIDATMTPRYSVSRDEGRTWSPSVAVRAPGLNVALRPSIVAGDEGRIAISYLGASSPGGPAFLEGLAPSSPLGQTPHEPDLALVSNLTWSAFTSLTLDALAPDPVFATGMLNPIGDPVHLGYQLGGVEDYADNGMDPTTGAVWYSSGDTCHPAEGLCPLDPIPSSRYWEKPSRGYVGVQVGGTGLLNGFRPAS